MDSVFEIGKPGPYKVADLWKSFFMDNQKRKKDPFSPAIRSKGEKARNSRRRLAEMKKG